MFEWVKLVEAAKACLPMLVISVGVFGVFSVFAVAASENRPALLWLLIPVVYVAAVMTTMLVMQ